MMVAISPRFTFLVTLCVLAAFSSAPISDAAVLRLRDLDPISAEMTSTHGNAMAATRFSSRVVKGPLVIPLPKGHETPQKGYGDGDRKKLSGGGTHRDDKDVSADEDNDDYLYDDNGAVSKKDGNVKVKVGGYIHHALAPRHHHHPNGSGKAIVSGDHEHIRVDRSPRSHHHHHHGNGKVVISGDHEHIHIDRSPAPHHPHHHQSGHSQEKVVISGDHEHIHIERSPSPDHHHHHHHIEHEKIVVTGDHDHVRIDRSEDENDIISGDNDHIYRKRSILIAGEQGQPYVVPLVKKRSASQERFALPPSGKRSDDMDGAPGRIDIMSPNVDPSVPTRIASLVLASSTMSANSTASNEFVLNASDMNATQIYLRPSSFNSTNSTLNSDEIGVTLRMAMFDEALARIVPYCATFDPYPPAPAPLIAEECTDDPVSEDKSQLFAFHKTSGTVRPMWFKDDERDSQSDGCQGVPQDASLSNANVTEADNSRPVSSESADQDLRSNFGSITTDPSQMERSDSSEGPIAQEVTLLFVSSDPEIQDTPVDASRTSSPVLETKTGAEASNSALASTTPSITAIPSSSPESLSAASPTAQVTTSSFGSVSAMVSSGAPASVPSPTALGVQVVAESASDPISSRSASAPPVMTAMNTQPYAWIFMQD
ncbi:hypothetical protein F5148DRAFT_1245854 [Russula earlei]|uniref:Uncharacterized protein n=1 Tax=Russula earlei TaxID=71964 RepID=A0ACC0TUH9_9AGAM|nr:hypothetical protein F5148DRAFT_1245854 [Russula earlei]